MSLQSSSHLLTIQLRNGSSSPKRQKTDSTTTTSKKTLILDQTCKVLSTDENLFIPLGTQTDGMQTYKLNLKQHFCRPCQTYFLSRRLHYMGDTHQFQDKHFRLSTADPTVTCTLNSLSIRLSISDSNPLPIQSQQEIYQPNLIESTYELTLHNDATKDTFITNLFYEDLLEDVTISTTTFPTYHQNQICVQPLNINIPGQTSHIIGQLHLKGSKPLTCQPTIIFTVKTGSTHVFYVKESIHLIRGDKYLDFTTDKLQQVKTTPWNQQRIPSTDRTPQTEHFLKLFPQLQPSEVNLFKFLNDPSYSHSVLRSNLHNTIAESQSLLQKPLEQSIYLQKLSLQHRLETHTNIEHNLYLSQARILDFTPNAHNSNETLIRVACHSSNSLAIKQANHVTIRFNDKFYPATINRVEPDFIQLHLPTTPEGLNIASPIDIARNSNNYVNHVLETTLHNVGKHKLQEYLFPDLANATTQQNKTQYFLELNSEQQQAVTNAMNFNPIAPFLLYGPAGCGKTKIILELSIQHAKLGQTVLICAPTNQGVSNLHSKITRATRAICPNKIVTKALVDGTPLGDNCFDCSIDDTNTYHIFPKTETLLQSAIIISTLTTSIKLSNLINSKIAADVIIIDEAAFPKEIDCLIPIVSQLAQETKTPRVILAGDQHQLTNCPRSTAAANSGYGTSLLVRLLSTPQYQSTPNMSFMLRMNHRNPVVIINILNNLLYNNMILSPSNAALGQIKAINVTSSPTTRNNESSRFSTAEAQVAVDTAKHYTSNKTIIVCYYSSQATLINYLIKKQNLHNTFATTTENTQGGEADTIIISPTIRTDAFSPWHSNIQRNCMVTSRSKNIVIIVANLLPLSDYPVFSQLIKTSIETGNIDTVPRIEEELRRKLSIPPSPPLPHTQVTAN